MKKLGIIGGLGPMATAYFLQLITQMSDAATDQEHMEIYLISKPSMPDRTDYILGHSNQSPEDEMIAVGQQLRSMGAELLVMPCVTGHYFHKKIESGTGIPMINAIERTAGYLRDREISRAGILATDGTVRSGLLQRALEKYGIECILPDAAGQKRIMDIIYKEIKAGLSADMGRFHRVSKQLHQSGAQVILLACTELSLLKRDCSIGAGYLDMMEVMAAETVKCCARLKSGCRDLIT